MPNKSFTKLDKRIDKMLDEKFETQFKLIYGKIALLLAEIRAMRAEDAHLREKIQKSVRARKSIQREL